MQKCFDNGLTEVQGSLSVATAGQLQTPGDVSVEVKLVEPRTSSAILLEEVAERHTRESSLLGFDRVHATVIALHMSRCHKVSKSVFGGFLVIVRYIIATDRDVDNDVLVGIDYFHALVDCGDDVDVPMSTTVPKDMLFEICHWWEDYGD